MAPTILSAPVGNGGHGFSLMLIASIVVLGVAAVTMLVAKLYRRWF